MKIRCGFVSNSSSSSFMIWGICLETSKFEEISRQKGFEYLWEFEKTIPDDLDYILPPEESLRYIGIPWCLVNDDETGRQFKDRVEKLVKEWLGKDDLEFDTYEDAWYDG